MAGKNQIKRVRIIDRALRTGHRFTLDDLAEKCFDGGIESISPRTIQYDIAALRSGELGFEPAPIKNESGLYFYEDKNFTISKSPVQDEEAFVLMNALDILNQFPEFEHHEKVKEVVDKIKAALDLEEEEDSIQDVIQFEKTEYPAAAKWIPKLYPFVKYREAVKLFYQPFGAEEPLEIEIAPLLLKEFNGRWFLIGYNLELKVIHNYPLDRIKAFEACYVDLKEYKIHFNPHTHFKDAVGVTLFEEGPVTVKFKTSDHMCNYIKTKPFHHSQELVDSDQNLFEMKVHINFELIARILSYGPDVVVVEPVSLVERIKEKVEGMKNLYIKE